MANKNDSTKQKEKGKDMRAYLTSRNILIAAGIIFILLLLGVYVHRFNALQDKDKFNTSYLVETGTINLEIKNLNEVKQILTESPNEYFVLITYTGSKEEKSLEDGLKTIIDKYKLNDSFYYLNVQSIKDDEDLINKVNSAFDTDKIKAVPTILYYKDGKVIDVVKRDDKNMINASDFQKLLDIYEFEGQ